MDTISWFHIVFILVTKCIRVHSTIQTHSWCNVDFPEVSVLILINLSYSFFNPSFSGGASDNTFYAFWSARETSICVSLIVAYVWLTSLIFASVSVLDINNKAISSSFSLAFLWSLFAPSLSLTSRLVTSFEAVTSF